MEQNLTLGFKLVPNETQAKEEASKSVLFVVDIFFLCIDSLLITCHFAEFANEGVVGFEFFGCGHSGKPREADLGFGNLNGKFFCTQGFANEVSFGSHDAFEVFKVGIGEQALGHRNANPGGFFRFGTDVGFKTLIVKMLKQSFDNLAVSTVIKNEVAVLVDGEVVHLVGEAGCALVLNFLTEPFGNGEYHAFAFLSGNIEFDCHCEYLLVFLVVTYYRQVRHIFALAGDAVPAVIEIHPPFGDYTDFDGFIKSYKVFENSILERFPEICLLIENRCGSVYKGGRFLVSKSQEVETLRNLIVQHGLRLKIAYDVPQIYTAHNVKKQNQYIDLLCQAESYREQIGGVHLWGKRKSETGRKVAHCGDLTSYFEGDLETKVLFLQQFNKCFDDGICRKMVLEVNSGNEDMLSIIADLRENGVFFK